MSKESSLARTTSYAVDGHMEPSAVRYHRSVDPDFNSRLKTWVTLLLMGYKPYHYAVVEAPYPSKAACTSMWST